MLNMFPCLSLVVTSSTLGPTCADVHCHQRRPIREAAHEPPATLARLAVRAGGVQAAAHAVCHAAYGRPDDAVISLDPPLHESQVLFLDCRRGTLLDGGTALLAVARER